MTDVLSLLTLPGKNSKAFTAVKSSALHVVEPLDGSASPRRKAARLDTDSDAASASRSSHTRLNGPIKLTIVGDSLIKLGERDTDVKLGKELLLLQRSIRIILAPPQSGESNDPRARLPVSYEGIYSACRSIVATGNRGAELYDKLRLELEQSLIRLANNLGTKEIEWKDKGEKDDLPILWISAFIADCDWFEQQISLLASLLTYLDQVYVLGNPGTASIRSLSYTLFSGTIFTQHAIISARLRAGVLAWVNYERKFRLAHSLRSEIPKLIAHLTAHSQYTAFESNYVDIAIAFYTVESAELAQSMKSDARAFFNHISGRIEEEEQRSKDLLPIGSWDLVRKIVGQCIWGDRLEWVASSTVGRYVEIKDLTMLATMYKLFKRVDGVKFIVSAFRACALKRVESIVKDAAEDEKMVERLLEFKSLADTVINTSFLDEKVSLTSSTVTTQRNNDFVYALGDAFTNGFKARHNKPAEMIAKFLDRTMRKGQGGISTADYEALLDSALALYRFTDDKDVFRTFYHRMLAKRLLLQKSASDDFEAAMLKKLKDEYDPEFGMAEHMFKDLTLSRDAMREYHSKLDDESSGHKLSVMVLQSSAWPFTLPEAILHLPPSMQNDLGAYTEYYKGRHSGHTLSWDHALGTATLSARFKAGKKELSVSLYQTVVLLLFNDEDEWQYPDILKQTGIEPKELKRVLQSLACGKKKVLKKIPPGRDVDEDDQFRFNPDFDDPHTRVHINSIQAKVSPDESKRTNDSIEGDRRHYIEAAIVRVMKARKVLTFEAIKTETIDAVKKHFVPSVDGIKKGVDWCVSNEYLRRDEDDKKKFHYVA
ncbi:hypothetical protein C0991_011443 [Blastosporella zonata]|nr:hypothetical protein C0991_011443 [Blastosporella zonata]